MHRRNFLTSTVVATAGAAVALSESSSASAGGRMTMDLVCGALGVQADQFEAIELAARHGFESVGANVGHLSAMSPEDRSRVLDQLEQEGLVWGAGGLPVQFREDEARFQNDLASLSRASDILEEVGVTRVSTWIMPAHGALTYIHNFRQHAKRLRIIARILGANGIRFGLEYVGPRTSWTSQRYPFIHSMAEMKDLIAEIDEWNVGFVLDSWHWYTAEENESDLLTLSNKDVVAVDLNDAPEGIPVDEQMDLKRRLPASTGVIDVETFLSALVKIGYDGPVRAEPFDASLREMPPNEAVSKTAAAMKRAFATI